MAYTCSEFMEKVLKGYESSYDVVRLQEEEAPQGLPLAATATMHINEASYVVSKKFETWSVNSSEYVYFFTVPKLDDATTESCIRYAYEDGMSKIDLKSMKNHMCTRLVAVFIADEADPEAVTRVKKCKLYKSFQFSLKGWMEFHAVAVDLGKESAESNRYGVETAKFMKNVLNPAGRKKDRRKWNIIKQMLD